MNKDLREYSSKELLNEIKRREDKKKETPKIKELNELSIYDFMPLYYLCKRYVGSYYGECRMKYPWVRIIAAALCIFYSENITERLSNIDSYWNVPYKNICKEIKEVETWVAQEIIGLE